MSTYQEIRHQIETLSPDEQLRLLEELAAIVRHRVVANPKPEQPLSAVPEAVIGSRWAGMSALEAARSVIGVVGEGPPDLSTNPKYLEGFGEQ